MKLYPNGVVIATAVRTGKRRQANAPERTKNKGWTTHAAKRNREFLFSVPLETLTGYGYSFTLTTRDTIPPKRFHYNLRRWWDKQKYHGALRLHWVIEWQRRGTPHLHGCIWYQQAQEVRLYYNPSPTEEELALEEEGIKRPDLAKYRLLDDWVAINSGNASIYGQDSKDIDDNLIWFEYLAKHGIRSVTNYQRHSENIPPSWQESTGRIWGKSGEWYTEKPLQIVNMEPEEEIELNFKHRRLVTKYLAARAKTLTEKLYWKNYRKTVDRSRRSESYDDDEYYYADNLSKEHYYADNIHLSHMFKGLSSFIHRKVSIYMLAFLNSNIELSDGNGKTYHIAELLI